MGTLLILWSVKLAICRIPQAKMTLAERCRVFSPDYPLTMLNHELFGPEAGCEDLKSVLYLSSFSCSGHTQLYTLGTLSAPQMRETVRLSGVIHL